MERARVAVIDDDENMRTMVRYYLEGVTRHEVVAEAGDMDSALELLDGIQDGSVDADVILLDGNLSGQDRTGADARALMEAVHERGIGAAVLGFSSEPMINYGIEVEADTRKSLPLVAQAIDRLEQP